MTLANLNEHANKAGGGDVPGIIQRDLIGEILFSLESANGQLIVRVGKLIRDGYRLGGEQSMLEAAQAQGLDDPGVFNIEDPLVERKLRTRLIESPKPTAHYGATWRRRWLMVLPAEKPRNNCPIAFACSSSSRVIAQGRSRVPRLAQRLRKPSTNRDAKRACRSSRGFGQENRPDAKIMPRRKEQRSANPFPTMSSSPSRVLTSGAITRATHRCLRVKAFHAAAQLWHVLMETPSRPSSPATASAASSPTNNSCNATSSVHRRTKP